MQINKYRVSIRRSLADVKPEAEQIDGKVYRFYKGWPIENAETSLYQGEWAMIPIDKDYPKTAPIWIASGDLVPEEQ